LLPQLTQSSDSRSDSGGFLSIHAIRNPLLPPQATQCPGLNRSEATTAACTAPDARHAAKSR
jgi:hypothetical protein